MDRIVWVYWQNVAGVDPPPHIILCHRILQKTCVSCDVRLVTPSNVHEFLPDLDPRVQNIEIPGHPHRSLAVRCAVIRASLLERFGGFYIDLDCVALRDFGALFTLFRDKEFIGIRRDANRDRPPPRARFPGANTLLVRRVRAMKARLGRALSGRPSPAPVYRGAGSTYISVGSYGSVRGGRIISEYAKALRRRVASKTDVMLNELGAWTLTPIVDRHPDTVHLIPERLVQPIVSHRQDLFLDTNLAPEDIIPVDSLCLMLFHRTFENELKGVGLRDLYERDYLVSRVFRRALSRDEFEDLYVQATERRLPLFG
ncbi:MAG: hypothetical protein EXQ94_03440 [Alphaproteobacteria bacterium]|nr:hypothetical protein [Alphaproteobacteria bacterium]